MTEEYQVKLYRSIGYGVDGRQTEGWYAMLCTRDESLLCQVFNVDKWQTLASLGKAMAGK